MVKLVYEVVVRRSVIGDPSLGVAGVIAWSMALYPPRGRHRPPLVIRNLPRPRLVGIHEYDMLLSLLLSVCRLSVLQLLLAETVWGNECRSSKKFTSESRLKFCIVAKEVICFYEG